MENQSKFPQTFPLHQTRVKDDDDDVEDHHKRVEKEAAFHFTRRFPRLCPTGFWGFESRRSARPVFVPSNAGKNSRTSCALDGIVQNHRNETSGLAPSKTTRKRIHLQLPGSIGGPILRTRRSRRAEMFPERAV